MSIKVLKFGADWCAACKRADAYLDRTEGERDFVVEKIDVDQDEELTIKYQIRSLPTFIAVKPNGDIVAKFVGFDNQKIKDFFEEIKYL